MLDLLILSETVNGRWRPGIGDPTVVGWLTVAAYLVAAACCGGASITEPPADARPRKQPVTFWLVLAFLMLMLGINKQLDLQTFVTEIGRGVLKRAALYQDRRVYQVAFIGSVAAACTLLLAWFLWASRRSIRYRWPALVGMAFILGFVVIRAASFHHVDALLASRLGGLKWNWLLELSGIVVVGASAGRVCRNRNSRAAGMSNFNNNIFNYYNKSK